MKAMRSALVRLQIMPFSFALEVKSQACADHPIGFDLASVDDDCWLVALQVSGFEVLAGEYVVDVHVSWSFVG